MELYCSLCTETQHLIVVGNIFVVITEIPSIVRIRTSPNAGFSDRRSSFSSVISSRGHPPRATHILVVST